MLSEVPSEPIDLEHFQARIIQDAMDHATIAYWLRRHKDLSKALPREGDFTGAATASEINVRAGSIRAMLAEIEHHIEMLQEQQEPGDETWNMLQQGGIDAVRHR